MSPKSGSSGCLGCIFVLLPATAVVLFILYLFSGSNQSSRSVSDEPSDIGRVHALCGPAVERLASNTYRWLAGGFFDWKFTHTRATDDPNVTTYLGDGIEFQNGFGTWVRHVYECDFDHSRLVSCLSSSMHNSSPFRNAETPLIPHQGADRIMSCVSGTAH